MPNNNISDSIYNYLKNMTSMKGNYRQFTKKKGNCRRKCHRKYFTILKEKM